MDRDDFHVFSVVRHDEGFNMRSPVFEREAWVLMLNFPLDYQTNYYVNKAVSLFGRLELWHNPRADMTRVLVKVLIKSVRLVPYSLIVTRAANIFGLLGRSWSVPVYVLHGRNVNPDVVGNEDPVPPMNASPHPYTLPFLNAAQQQHFEMQVWQQQNADIPWEAAAPVVQVDDGEWGNWPYEGESLRSITEYDGPSMMDGVVPDGNISDDPAAWSPMLEMEAAADNVVSGRATGNIMFLRAGGDNLQLEVEASTGTPSLFSLGESSSRVRSLFVVPEHVLQSEVVACVSWNIWKIRNELIFQSIPASFVRWRRSFQSDLWVHKFRIKATSVQPLIDWLLSIPS
jgi:hypothetical protein